MGIADDVQGLSKRLVEPLRAWFVPWNAYPLGKITSGARVFNNANITIASATSTVLTFNSERYDTDGYHSTSSNTGRLTVPADGLYRITGIVRWASNGTSYRQAGIRFGGGNFLAFSIMPPAATTVTVQIVTCDYELGAGDYVELEARQDTGGNLDVQVASNYSPEFMIAKL